MMKSIKKYFKIIFLLPIIVFSSACKKDYLDAKPDQSFLVPTTLADMQAILDNNVVMTYTSGLPVFSTDDYQITTSASLATFSAPQRNSYSWATDIWEGAATSDWTLPYRQIFYANIVLDGLEKIKITDANQTEWNSIKGSSLFYRAIALYQLANQFASPYNSATANNLPGIPIKLSSDVNERPGRGTLKQVYDQILADLNNGVSLLPLKQDQYLTRPSKMAVYALLSRIYLVMQDYKNAMIFADNALKIKSTLLDFNNLSKTSTRPISLNDAANSEVIYWQWMIYYSFASSAVSNIASEIVDSYDSNDLRKTIYLRNRGIGVNTFKGTYTGDNTYLFVGLATDEMYLIRAECKARLDDVNGAMADLNTLMIKRWDKNVAFPAYNATDSEDALRKVLAERRKELITRGTRWTDLRRLNQDTQLSITLKRVIDNKEYFLYPNDKKYVFPIPQNEIDGSGIMQNER